jgi:uncharacterized Zn-binding protein involved in type VI secretion
MNTSIAIAALAAVLVSTPALAQAAAARIGDTTSHGGRVTAGSSNVLIGGMPAARAGDFASCPRVDVLPNGEVIPHVGGPIVTGSSTVLINGVPAARVGDTIREQTTPSTIVSGFAIVLIGG